MFEIIQSIALAVLGYLKADWYIILLGVLIAVSINVYGDPEKMRNWFEKRSGLSVPAAVAFGAFTPLCACGTMAVILSMFISALPWGPVMAFLISSPLTSPSEFLFEGAFLGWHFATGMLIASVILGFGAGFAATWLERHTKFFSNQLRLVSESKDAAASCCEAIPNETVSCCSGSRTAAVPLPITMGYVQPECCGGEAVLNPSTGHSGWLETARRWKLDRFVHEFWELGIKKILLYFVIFIAAGRVVEMLIPAVWITQVFGTGSALSIPLAATMGLPLYITDASAMPLMRSFINAGASPGAVMAFLIAGKATGVPVMAGLATILRTRAFAFYIVFIYAGAIVAGYGYLLVSKLF